MTEVVEAEVVEQSAEIVPVASAPPSSLFRTEDPVEILEKATAVAEALAPVIRKAGLVANIQGKEYLQVEAWQTCGQQVGVTPVVTSTRRLADPDGWEARCEARTLDGRTIGAADSMCLRTEERWKDAEDFEIRSMAQTRAMSRALASVLRFIPTLAGMAGTPAEEMDRVRQSGGSKTGFASDRQRNFAERLLKEAGFNEQGTADVAYYMSRTMSRSEISKTIDKLKEESTRTAMADELGRQAEAFQAKVAAEDQDVPAPQDPEAEGHNEEIPF